LKRTDKERERERQREIRELLQDFGTEFVNWVVLGVILVVGDWLLGKVFVAERQRRKENTRRRQPSDFREGESEREFCELLLGSILFVGNCSWKTGEIGWVAEKEKEKEKEKEEEEEQQQQRRPKKKEDRPELLN
jgi:hypothetical protein